MFGFKVEGERRKRKRKNEKKGDFRVPW